jgi:hypothetical protein
MSAAKGSVMLVLRALVDSWIAVRPPTAAT